MPVINVKVRYTSANSKLAEATLQDAALAIESAVSVALLELCGAVEIDRVQVVEEPESVPLLAGSTQPDATLRESAPAR